MTDTITIPGNILRSIKAAQAAGRASSHKAWHGIFLAHRATGLGKRPLHRAMTEAGVIDYSASLVGFIITDTAELPADATLEAVVEARQAGDATRKANKSANKAESNADAAPGNDDTPVGDAANAANNGANLTTGLRALRAAVAIMGVAALPLIVEAYGDAHLAQAVFDATVKANRKAANLATV